MSNTKKMSFKYDLQVNFEAQTVGTEVSKSLCLAKDVENAQMLVEPYEQTVITPFTVTKIGINELLITYKPTIPNEISDAFYLIKRSGTNDQILYLQGASLGLSVVASIKNLVLYRLKNCFKFKSTFELTNNSNVSITFQFDIDNNQKIFQIEPKSGHISPGKYCFVEAGFVTEKPGVFLIQLACLILHGEPIFIDFFGVNAVKEDKLFLDKFKETFIVPPSQENSFEKYTRSYMCDNELRPVLQFSENYINFAENRQLMIKIVNLGKKCVEYLWDIENEPVFSLRQTRTCLRPGETDYIDCYFKPHIKDCLFSAVLYGKAIMFEDYHLLRICEENMSCTQIPICISFVGHSFTGPNRWFPQIELSSEIFIMPVCAPIQNVFTTFLIKKNGHLPILFQFIGPTNSNYSVKPEQGLIIEKFQIIVVKFTPQYKFNRKYVENWKIQLNHSENDFHDVSFHVIVQNPELCMGTENVVTCKTIYPGCQQFLTVPFQNLTQLCLMYKFLNNKWISFEDQTGTINCHETINLNVIYTADYDIPEDLIVKYEIWVLQGDLKIGQSYEFVVIFKASCSYSKICTNPQYFNFNEIICTETYTKTFEIYNFGISAINYLLRYVKVKDIKDALNLKIEPFKGVLEPGGRQTITVTLKTLKIGAFAGCIRYDIRLNEISDVLVETDDQFWKNDNVICNIEFDSFYPTLEVQQVGKNVAGSLFGNVTIWEIFAIESFNCCLRQIKANETKTFAMRVPDAEFDLGITKRIAFIMKNTTSVETFCKFERKKVCDCECKQIISKSSFRKYTYKDCPHRKMIDCYMSNEIIKPDGHEYMFVNMNYLLSGTTVACYVMRLSHNRNIEIYFHMKGLHPAHLSMYRSELHMQLYGVYLGEHYPDQQAFWIYNNTREVSHYELDVKILKKFNIRHRHDVITCLTPSSRVQPKTARAIIFKFAPVHDRYIRIKLPFTFGRESKTFVISGQGTLHYYSPINFIMGRSPKNDVYYFPGLFANISTEHIVIRSIPTNCSTTRWLVLRNQFTSDVLGYWFRNYFRENVIYVLIIPETGILLPKERALIMVKVTTFGASVAIRRTLNCHLINKSALLRHTDSKSQYYNEANYLQNQFNMNGTQTTYPTPSVEIQPAPKLFHRCITLSCYIVGSGDIDLKMSINQQLKQEPFAQFPKYSISTRDRILAKKWGNNKAIKSDIKKGTREYVTCSTVCCITLSDEEYNVIRIFLECLIRDVLYCKRLKYYVKTKIEPMPFYSQYLFDESQRDEERDITTMTMNRIPDITLSKVFQCLIEESLMHYFGLGAHPGIMSTECPKRGTYDLNQYMTNIYPEKFLFLLDD